MSDTKPKLNLQFTNLWVKIVALVVMLCMAFLGGKEFYELRHYKESFVAAEGLTEVKMLSDYEPSIKGTYFDTPIFIWDSGVEGGSVLYCANTHPYEPASSLSAYILMENIKVTKGKVFVIPQANYSASTTGMLGNAYPKFHYVQTDFGPKAYRIGDRVSNPLDHWPDPFTYVHYPSNQKLAYQDIRNLNRAFPGRPDGTPTERAAYGITELIRKENIDISIDIHEASIMYPVVGTYVAHQRSMDIAMMAAMDLTATTYDMKCENSPTGLHGLSHREWGDFTDTLAVLMETPEPFIDRVVGPMTQELMTEGKDEFLAVAAEHHLTYVPYNIDFGSPMWYRVGRHLSGALKVIEYAKMLNGIDIEVTWPTYQELEAHNCGYFLHDPAKADPSRVYYV